MPVDSAMKLRFRGRLKHFRRALVLLGSTNAWNAWDHCSIVTSRLRYAERHTMLENKATFCIMQRLLPQLAQRDLLVIVLVQNLCGRQVEIFLCHMYSSLPQREHASFSAYTF